jgi:hypothetical protein
VGHNQFVGGYGWSPLGKAVIMAKHRRNKRPVYWQCGGVSLANCVDGKNFRLKFNVPRQERIQRLYYNFHEGLTAEFQNLLVVHVFQSTLL